MLAVSAQGVSITFSFEGELYLDRHIDIPLSAMVAAGSESRDKLLENIAVQVRRSIDYVRRSLPFMQIGRIMIAPLPAPIPLRDYLAENIPEPVEMVDLASVFDFSRTPELAAEESQARFFGVLGAALRGNGAAA
jgi:MSHA biogenesis protein MshI